MDTDKTQPFLLLIRVHPCPSVAKICFAFTPILSAAVRYDRMRHVRIAKIKAQICTKRFRGSAHYASNVGYNP